MQTTLKQITRDVAVMLGEPLLPECEPEEGILPALDSRVRLSAPGVLAELILTLPAEMLTGWKTLTGCSLTVDGNGTGIITLPEDFLRLGSLRLTEMRAGIEKTLADDDPLKEVLCSEWAGVRGSVERPRAVLAPGPDGSRVIKIYSASPEAVIEEGYYISAPVFDGNDRMDVPDRIYGEFVKRLAGELKENEI